jgi:hypothetical protein
MTHQEHTQLYSHACSATALSSCPNPKLDIC